ncbi:MAG TPA: methyltransferase domain-containing protein [Verrucomicrobiae bacterium]|nr:methyltransferase domain-containing protein [Verrucomicrobiae bacterium]
MPTPLTQKVIEANIAVHSRLAAQYQECEPHFRPENVAKVERRLAALVPETRAESLLDLGCGTGFMINIAKRYVRRIVGVDVTPAMLERVDRSGANIELVNHDTGTYPVACGAFQLVTAYSFLHHLAELAPTLSTASRALASGGKFYADLDPNYYFWENIYTLERGGDYHPLVRREIEAVTFKDEEIEAKFGVSREVFNHAEFGKDIAGGFKEETLRQELVEAGFSRVEFHYHWFLGEGFLINSGLLARAELMQQAAIVHEALQRALPVSRNLFKYLGFVATK